MSLVDLRLIPAVLRRAGAIGLVALSILSPGISIFAQVPVPSDSKSSGDAPDDPGPLATNLSAELKPKAIQAVIKKVGDWQVKVEKRHFNLLWKKARCYDGLYPRLKGN